MSIYQAIVLAGGLFTLAVALGGLWSGAFFTDCARPIRHRRRSARGTR